MTTELETLSEMVGALQKCVAALAATHDDSPAMRRLVNDAERILNGVDRLDIDIEELGLARGHIPSSAMIQIPDTEYDLDFWRDVDHEGIGGKCGT